MIIICTGENLHFYDLRQNNKLAKIYIVDYGCCFSYEIIEHKRRYTVVHFLLLPKDPKNRYCIIIIRVTCTPEMDRGNSWQTFANKYSREVNLCSLFNVHLGNYLPTLTRTQTQLHRST